MQRNSRQSQDPVQYVSNTSGITVLCNGLCHGTNKKDVWQKVEEECKSKHFYWGPWRRINVEHECCLSPHERRAGVRARRGRSRDRAARRMDRRQPTYLEIILKNSPFTNFVSPLLWLGIEIIRLCNRVCLSRVLLFVELTDESRGGADRSHVCCYWHTWVLWALRLRCGYR